MTTTITLKTHSWPTRIVSRDNFESECGTHKHHGVTEEIVPPYSTRTVHITQSRSIEFIELPLPPADAG